MEHVLDPDGGVVLVRVRGLVGTETADAVELVTSGLPPHRGVHLDLADAVIPDRVVMERWERLADRLERRVAHVRVVGVDPDHPLLHQGR